MSAPLGATLHSVKGVDGVRFAVWAPQAVGVDVCLFDTATGPQTRRIALRPAGNGLWQTFVPGLAAGQLYGLRADGPWQPETGHRFNPARLLLDPWARALAGDTTRLALQTGHAVADPLRPGPYSMPRHGWPPFSSISPIRPNGMPETSTSQ